jgi:thiamine-monophosphate kinase
MRPGDLGEFRLIERLRVVLGTAGASPGHGAVRLGIGDDAAVLAADPGREWVVTSDTLVEAVHFRRDWTSPVDLGWKALAVNVSDLGAMGATPLGALVTAAVPADLEVEWLEALYQGLGACAAEYGCPVVGGDTVRSPQGVMLTVSALGTLPAGAAVTRAGARPGDLICVTGTLGDSAAGLALLLAGRTAASDPEFAPLFAAHLRPRPPIRAAAGLACAGVTAMMDLSDGLASDLARLSERSGVGARVLEDRLPISLRARDAAEALGVDPAEWALRGGEDYELLFTVPPAAFHALPPLLAAFRVVATRIGALVAGERTLVREDGSEVALGEPAFTHFPP